MTSGCKTTWWVALGVVGGMTALLVGPGMAAEAAKPAPAKPAASAPTAAVMPAPPPGMERIEDAAKVMAEQDAIMKTFGMDLNRLTAVRFKLSGEPMECVSVQPLEVAEVMWNGLKSKTIFALDQKQEHWRLFSREPDSGAAVSVALPVGNLKPGYQFTFPVVGPGGKLQQKVVEIVGVKSQ